MPLPLKEFVQQVLLEGNRAAKIHRAIRNAWKTADEKYPERANWRRKSTFRGLFWEEAIRELSAIASEDAGFVVIEHRDTVSFILENSVLFRFKHADLALGTANYPTPEATSFDDHENDLYGFAGLQRVELCHVFNEFETEIIWIGITARNMGRHLWKLELSDLGISIPAPELPIVMPEMDTAKLVRVKKTDNDQGREKKKDNG
ncbi:MAG: hypothetical protein KGQ46_04515 [Hyphomicrobiales bacterium]|nr:hypothetical protein [Hyphomicrobiales bacterium]MDE2114723.1 hypothetical protein [Hyphomicrobiales bacterium]